MAKMRGIKPEFWTDSKVVSVSPLARLLFLGMWTFACDNGHIDDDTIQLKIRVLPVDSCDVEALLDELILVGVVERRDGFLKVVKLSEHQRIDLRYLTLCDHCEHDGDSKWSPRDRVGRTSGTRSAPNGHTSGTQRAHVVEGEGEGEGEEKGVQGGTDALRATDPPTPKKPRQSRGTRIPEDFVLTDDMRAWATKQEVDHVDLDRATAKFINYWTGKSGRNATKVDWIATWRNWIYSEAEHVPRRPSPRTTPAADPWATAALIT